MNVLPPESLDDAANKALGLWAAKQIGLPRPFEEFAALGVFEGEELKAVAVFHNWAPECGVIELSLAGVGGRWMTRPVLWAMFSWAFDRRGCQLVVSRVSEKNRQENGRGLVRICHAYGFEEVFVPRLRGRDEGEYILTLTDDAWRSNGFHKEHMNG